MSKRLSEIDLYQAYKNWYIESGPFCCFFRATNFVTLKHYPDFELDGVPEVESDFVRQIKKQIEKINVDDILIFMDLPGELAVETAYWLKKDKDIQSILTFNNILHPYGLVGTKKFISYLIQFGETKRRQETKAYAIILDQSRFGDYSEDELKSSFNNQYELSEEDLPSFEMLEDLKYTGILYIHKGELKEDILPYLEYLEENRLQVKKVDLNSI